MKNRISLAIFLLSTFLPALAQIGGDYNPESPSDPGVPVQKYTLSLKATPEGGGSFNTATTEVKIGENYNLRAYPNSDFAFVAWICDGDTLSKSASYSYVMPSHDVEITGVFVYCPDSPADPQQEALKYQLSIVAEPANSGSFNFSSERIAVGSTTSFRAYTNTDFVFKRWVLDGEELSTNPSYDFVMPAHPVQIIGQFVYNPASPASPNQNYWNALTGEVIVDMFTPGSLSSAVSAAISGSNSGDVQMITVAGRMSDYDFGIANSYSNCSLLDLSRVAGITEIPSYAFDYTKLESVYLPASIEKIGYRAFAECSQLSSVSLYAMTPPALEDDVFSGVPDGLVVYVPAGAIGQYQDSEAWSKFTLLPIQEDIRSISVSLPNGTKASDYAKMWLELTNTKSGQRMHYIMTEREVYTFANIIKNTSWNVVLRNERGDVFGKIDNVEVKDEDVSVSFASLAKPQTVSLAVQTPDGKDVAGQTQITWTDGSGNYIAQGTSLSALPVGYQLNYSVTLSQDLAMLYGAPNLTAYTLKDGGNSLACKLENIKQVQITGKVKDVSTGMALSGAVVSASQTFGGKYSKTINGKTDANGVFTLTVANVPTSMAFAATDYISQSVNLDNGLNELNELADVLLKPISGATITVGFNYTTVDGETQNWYSDYQNVGYTLYNKTRKKSISQFNVQYPQIVLLEEVSEGDVLELTAESKTQAFMPVKATATITANQTAEAQFSIVELGQLKADYSQSGNVNVVASLYDSNGKLLKTYDYQDMSLTVSNLSDGNYTLVSMGSSQFFNSIYDLAQLPQTGLKAGTDYVQNAISVKSGAVTTVHIDLVPKLDESKLYYTGDNTSFTVNKPSIVAGNYLTLTGRIDFKQAYATNVSNVQMIIDLPESCEFVENSVMVGNSTSSYILNGHQLSIPMARYTDRVRFCVIPTLGGEYAPSAFAQFDLNGKTIKQPMGSANYTAKDLSISVPSTVAKTSIPVSGNAFRKSTIEIYDNGVIIGRTESLANGTWATTVELDNPYNLSSHNIYARITTSNNTVIQSETQTVTYDVNAIQVAKVVMYHNNPEMRKTFEIVYDFINPSSVAQKYTYYIYNKVFTFTIDFTLNDPKRISDVVLYVKTGKGLWIPVQTLFDANKQQWVGIGEFGNMYDGDIPVNVAVKYQYEGKALYDAMDILTNFTQNSGNELQEELDKIDLLFTNPDKIEYADIDLIFADIEGIEENAEEQIDYESLSEEELEIILDECIDKLKKFDFASFVETPADAEFGTLTMGPYTIKKTNCNELTKEVLLESGYIEMAVNDTEAIYILRKDNIFGLASLVNNILVEISNNETTHNTRGNADSGDQAQAIWNWETLLLEEKLLDKAFNEKISNIKDLHKEWKKARRINKMCETRGFEKGAAKWASNKSALTASIKGAAKNAKYIKYLKPIGKSIPFFDAAINGYQGYEKFKKLDELLNKIPTECNDQEAINNSVYLQLDIQSIKGNVVGYYTTNTAASHGAGMGVAALGAAFPPSLIVTIPAVVYGQYRADKWFDSNFENDLKRLKAELKSIRKRCKDDDDNDQDDHGEDSGSEDSDPSIDPSGYVYEGVFSNRVEGATATVYYKETVEDMYGDLHENIVKWDAEEYAQENPLFTDENGYYRWDVPQGLWQVKFEKEGYETTYSEWLPVPPPQLDINIAMTQNRQPEVKSARAFEDAVELEFDKYMQPELLTTDNIIVMAGDKAVEGTIELLNEEVACEGATETFASKVRFNAAQPFEGTEVTLMVSNRVRSYAGIRMQDDFSQQFTIEEEVRQIDCKEMVKVAYGHNSTVSVAVLPASAAAAKTLRVKSSSAMILSTDAECLVLDKDGRAEIKVHGELPGTAALTFSVDGYDLTATTTVNVVTTLLGDVNGDGEVNAADIVILQNYLSGQQTADFDEAAADADGNGSITAADVPAIVAIILNKR